MLDLLLRVLYGALIGLAYLMAFFKLLPSTILAALLGIFSGMLVWGYGRHALEKSGFHRSAALLAILVWKLLALTAAAWLGGTWGHFVIHTEKGRRIGMCFAIFFYFMGDLLFIWLKHNKEE